MAEYFAKDDLIKDLEYLESLGCDSLPLREMRERIEYGAVKAVDAVEVVRCKNCVRSGTTEFGKRFCKEPLGMYGSVPVDDNGFCSHGRREHDNA